MKEELSVLKSIQNSIIILRGYRVMLDTDLARLYGVSTKALNQQVKRNVSRFPKDFMFQLFKEEKKWIIENYPHLSRLKFSASQPYAFTEHGAIMLASVLSSQIAISASVQVVRAFILLREMASKNHELAKRLEQLEKKYDSQFKTVFDAIKQMMCPPTPTKRPIGIRGPKLEDKKSN